MPPLTRLKNLVAQYPNLLSTRKLARVGQVSISAMSRILNHNLWPARIDKIGIQRRIQAYLTANALVGGQEIWFPDPDSSESWICPGCGKKTQHHARNLCKHCYSVDHRVRQHARQTATRDFDLADLYSFEQDATNLKLRASLLAAELLKLREEIARKDAHIIELETELCALHHQYEDAADLVTARESLDESGAVPWQDVSIERSLL
jgi:hypothetical protein